MLGGIKTIALFLVEGPGEVGEMSMFFFDGFPSGFLFLVSGPSVTVLGISSTASTFPSGFLWFEGPACAFNCPPSLLKGASHSSFFFRRAVLHHFFLRLHIAILNTFIVTPHWNVLLLLLPLLYCRHFFNEVGM